MRPGLFALFAGLGCSLAQGAELPSPIETHPALEISLFAQEPDVTDPVALCFDASGRMYVIEMRDYPYGIPPENEPGGTVRLLEDTDRDGRADRSVLFAENLSYPTSIAPYRNGVIVTAPPEIIFLADTDGDGKADIREVLYRGFRRAVTDGNMSGLRWGLDNWLHGVNGGPGGHIISSRKRGEGLRLGDLDFRLLPDTGEIETTYSTGGGFGLVFDEWGRSFTPHNINHMQMRIMPAGSSSRHPGLPPIKGTESISDHEAMARIFPISQAQTRPNHPEQAGYFSSSGGVGFIGHQGYPADLAGSVTVCDVVGNLVHRDVLTGNGPILRASRAPGEETKEFIASTDPAFRPTGLELGPDGALYLMDMHRDVIEHPDYIPKRMLEKMDIRAGDQQGRIYRIIPVSGVRQNQSRMNRMKPNELVEELASPNQWRRMTAQRLIVEQNHLIASVPLRQVLKSHVNPVARLHALWALEGIGELDETMLLTAMNDAHPGVQENALRLAGNIMADRDNVQDELQQLAGNADTSRVRFIALQMTHEPDADTIREAVVNVLKTDGAFRWSRMAALSALPTGELAVLDRLISDPSFRAGSFAATALNELSNLAGTRLNDSTTEELNGLIQTINRASVAEPLKIAILSGLKAGLERHSTKLNEPELVASLESLARDTTPALQRAVWALEKQLGQPASASQQRAVANAIKTASDRQQSDSARVEAIRLLPLGDLSAATPALLACLNSNEPQAIQHTALEVLRQSTDVSIATGLLDQWRATHPSLKRPVTLLLLSRRPYHDPLLTAIEQGRIQIGELNLDLEDRRRLLRWSAPAIQKRAETILGDGEYGNRQEKAEEWLGRLPADGNAAAGKDVFQTACAQCHRVGELGFDVGPNLTGMSHRSVEDLVSNILDPNMAINPNYVSVSIETKDGELYTGIMTAETSDAITLLQAQGIKATLSRNEIERLESNGTSLMPEGLEATMSPQQLRDLVAFLQE